jgi:uncharacterized membrane protein
MLATGVDTIRSLRRVLWILLWVSLVGVAFSATLTYQELTGIATACPAVGASGTIFGQPPCVYGLVMYGLLGAIASFALVRTRSRDLARV